MKANVYVTLKQEVLDPQGDAVRRALSTLGFDTVRGVRIGKLIEIELSEQPTAEAELKKMCEKLLANAVVEDFRFEVIK